MTIFRLKWTVRVCVLKSNRPIPAYHGLSFTVRSQVNFFCTEMFLATLGWLFGHWYPTAKWWFLGLIPTPQRSSRLPKRPDRWRKTHIYPTPSISTRIWKCSLALDRWNLACLSQRHKANHSCKVFPYRLAFGQNTSVTDRQTQTDDTSCHVRQQ